MIYYGRLVGQTDGESALTLVSEKNSYTGATAASPGSKMLAHGENAIGLAFNRMSGALAANIDYLAGMLDSPALRHDYLEPENTGGPPTWGFSALKDIAGGATEINLGTGTYTPTVWLYHGLFQSQVGDWMRLVRDHTEHRVDSGEVLPATDVLVKNGGSSVFRTDTEVGSADHRMPNTCAPMREVESDIAPYSGAIPSTVIAAWEEDGLRITAATFQELYVRPGCYLRVFGDNSGIPALGNDGLYQVAHITRSEDVGADGDKVILTQGGLHKVTVSSVVPYTAGDRVSWQSAPSHAAASSQWERTNYAYVMFIEGLNLYLLPCSGSDDFPIGGAGGIGAGQNIDTLTYAGRFQIGQVGLTTHESGGAQNHSLLVGTALYSDVGGTSAVVSNVDYAGTVKRFNINSSPLGSIRVVSPPGFALNPPVQIQAEAAGGDYRLDCRTLTTVREQQQAAGNSSIVAQSENPGDRLGLSMHERTSLLSWLKYTKVGGQLDAVSPSVTSGNRPFGGSRRVLGEERWRVTLVNETDATVPADAFNANSTYLFTHPDAVGPADTACRVLHATTTSVVFSSVNIADEPTNEWPGSANRSQYEPLKAGGVGAGSTCLNGGATYRISVIHYKPSLESDDLGDFIPGIGLGAAYNNDYDSNTTARFAGAGRYIEMMEDSRPVTYLTTSVATTKQIHKVMVGGGDTDTTTVVDRATGAVKSLWGHRDNVYTSLFFGDVNRYMQLTDEARNVYGILGWTALSMSFADSNIGLATPIDLSDAIYNTVPSQNETDTILNGIHGATSGTALTELSIAHGTRIFSDGLVGPKNPCTLPPAVFAVFAEDVTVGTLTHTGPPNLSTFVSNGDVVVMERENGLKHYAKISGVAGATATITPIWPDATKLLVSVSVIADPLQLEIAEAVLSNAGSLHRSKLHAIGGAPGGVFMTASTTQYVYWTASTNSMWRDTVANVDNTPGTVILAKCVMGADAIESVEPYTVPLSRIDTKTVITVGDWSNGGVGDIAQTNLQDAAHFANIGEAFRAIANEEAVRVANSRPTRSWEIRVLGPTTEYNDSDLGISIPLAVPADSVTISGAVSGLDYAGAVRQTPEVLWSSLLNLFDLNGKEGFAIRDLRFRNDIILTAGMTGGPPTEPDMVLVGNSDITGAIDTHVSGMTLENVHLYGGSAFVWMQDVTTGSSCSIRDCSIRECFTGGILFAGNAAKTFKDLTIDNFYAKTKTGMVTGDANTNFRYGIFVEDIERVTIANASLNSFFGKGVVVDNTAYADLESVYAYDCLDNAFELLSTDSGQPYRLSNCYGQINGAAGAAVVGMYATGSGQVRITDCMMSDSQSYGFNISVPATQMVNCISNACGDASYYIDDNLISLTQCLSTSPTAVGAFELTASADNCILQNCYAFNTVGFGISCLGDYVQVYNCTMNITSGVGMFINSDYAQIKSNTLLSVGTVANHGIHVQNSRAVTVEGNYVDMHANSIATELAIYFDDSTIVHPGFATLSGTAYDSSICRNNQTLEADIAVQSNEALVEGNHLGDGGFLYIAGWRCMVSNNYAGAGITSYSGEDNTISNCITENGDIYTFGDKSVVQGCHTRGGDIVNSTGDNSAIIGCTTEAGNLVVLAGDNHTMANCITGGGAIQHVGSDGRIQGCHTEGGQISVGGLHTDCSSNTTEGGRIYADSNSDGSVIQSNITGGGDIDLVSTQSVAVLNNRLSAVAVDADITLSSCTHCVVQGNDLQYKQAASATTDGGGVLLANSNHCRVIDNTLSSLTTNAVYCILTTESGTSGDNSYSNLIKGNTAPNFDIKLLGGGNVATHNNLMDLLAVAADTAQAGIGVIDFGSAVVKGRNYCTHNLANTANGGTNFTDAYNHKTV